ncbi:kinase domain protein [Gleimia coleocanis DSM 15436]|uniref:non-specific serine/threonine protein kinase n=1 Tax=Gleimia coleocanis DSM 15436 TaxID=525245 RepID=C0VY21_9ACTO|nr:serine/threonine-protein kinase [Gleimia coleocanis]EEH64324.1 kinase domain protein [Gleimia coleocanis DSM 15436]
MTTNHAGKVIGGRYTLIGQLATGGMGEVWSARDQVTARKVAVKVLKSELAGQEAFLTRLRIEAQNAMQINHPNLAAVLDHGELNGVGWIVMELVTGRPFNEYLTGGHRIPVSELIPVLIQTAQALQAAKLKDVVHRDIKPSNILITSEGVVKLTDFGISTTPNQVALTDVGMVMGTAQYLSPEQAMGESATHLSDLYSLGVIAYEALAGRRPFTGKTQVDIAFAHVNEPVPDLPADIPTQLRRIVLKMLRKNPKDRPADCGVVIKDLTKLAKSLGVSVAPRPLTLPSEGAERQRTGRLATRRGQEVPGRRRKLPTRPGTSVGTSTNNTPETRAMRTRRTHSARQNPELRYLFSPYGPIYGKRAKTRSEGPWRHSAVEPSMSVWEMLGLTFAVFLICFTLLFAYAKFQSLAAGSFQPIFEAFGLLDPASQNLSVSLDNTPSEVQKW